jgi:hypothetical protein
MNRIMIYGPKNDGTYIVEFKTAEGEALAISVPAGETAVLKHFQERMPYGLSCRTFREEPTANSFHCCNVRVSQWRLGYVARAFPAWTYESFGDPAPRLFGRGSRL